MNSFKLIPLEISVEEWGIFQISEKKKTINGSTLLRCFLVKSVKCTLSVVMLLSRLRPYPDGYLTVFSDLIFSDLRRSDRVDFYEPDVDEEIEPQIC